VRFRGVPELNDQRVSFERLLHDPSLNALAPSVNESYFTETGPVCGVDVLFDNGLDFAGRKRMKVERVLDGNSERIFSFQLCVRRTTLLQPS